jgi:hypothetical protein
LAEAQKQLREQVQVQVRLLALVQTRAQLLTQPLRAGFQAWYRESD